MKTTLALQRRIEGSFETAVIFWKTDDLYSDRDANNDNANIHSSTVQPSLTISTTLMRNGEAARRDSLSDFSLAMFAARVPRQTVTDPGSTDRLIEPPWGHAYTPVQGARNVSRSQLELMEHDRRRRRHHFCRPSYSGARPLPPPGAYTILYTYACRYNTASSSSSPSRSINLERVIICRELTFFFSSFTFSPSLSLSLSPSPSYLHTVVVVFDRTPLCVG